MAIRGINLAALAGPSSTSNYQTGPIDNSYTRDQVDRATSQKSGIRLGVNPATVRDPEAWRKTRDVIDWASQAGSVVVLSMWDSNVGGDHGDGLIDSVDEARHMWKTIGHDLAGRENIYFEAMNEPFGYHDVGQFLTTMRTITADLPHDHVIMPGMGWQTGLQAIKDSWDGLLGYHVYPWFQPEGHRTQSEVSNSIQRDLKGVAHRTFVTEFGADVSRTDIDYTQWQSGLKSEDAAFLLGANDGFSAMRPAGTFIWHGNPNGDTYDYWRATPSAKAQVDLAQSH